jgi:hypothetical protein
MSIRHPLRYNTIMTMFLVFGTSVEPDCFLAEQVILGKSGKKICCSCPDTKKVGLVISFFFVLCARGRGIRQKTFTTPLYLTGQR